MRTVQELYDYIKAQPWGAGMTDKVKLVLPDTQYSTPTIDYLLGPGLSAFNYNCQVTGIGSYVKNRNDCDKWVFRYVNFLHDSHELTQRRASDGGAETGISVGLLAYVEQDVFPAEGHMIAVAFLEGPMGLTHVFLECVPENGQGKLQLKELELDSISFCFV